MEQHATPSSGLQGHIGGFAIVDVATLPEAVELAKTWLAGGSVEIQQVVER